MMHYASMAEDQAQRELIALAMALETSQTSIQVLVVVSWMLK